MSKRPAAAENTELDLSDVDHRVGQLVGGGQLWDPCSSSDIRRWVMAMDYPNPLHWDQEFAHDSKFGGLIAPQSIAVGEGQEVGEHFATLEQRAREVDTVYALLGETLLERTTQDWLELLRSLDIPAAPVHTLDELFDNPHLNAVGFFETVDTPNGPVRFPGTPTWFSRTPGRIVGPAPRLGAHTQQIMGELGMAAGGEG